MYLNSFLLKFPPQAEGVVTAEESEELPPFSPPYDIISDIESAKKVLEAAQSIIANFKESSLEDGFMNSAPDVAFIMLAHAAILMLRLSRTKLDVTAFSSSSTSPKVSSPEELLSNSELEISEGDTLSRQFSFGPFSENLQTHVLEDQVARHYFKNALDSLAAAIGSSTSSSPIVGNASQISPSRSFLPHLADSLKALGYDSGLLSRAVGRRGLASGKGSIASIL
jgi:hypothetical protein